MSDVLIAIVTPVYNRVELMEVLYQSLQQQKNKNFYWLIVDDGSSDCLEIKVNAFRKTADFEIQYVKKENGGKHTALNVAFPMIRAELTFIVDSDDTLIADATELIEQYWNRVKNRTDIAGMTFLKGYTDDRMIGDRFPWSEEVCDPVDVLYHHKVGGDKAEVWKTDILAQYRFPEFRGEKFQGENYIWQQVYLKYKMLYVNKIIYLAEYLENGLSRQGRRLRNNCPLGGMENSSIAFDSRFPMWLRVKSAWLFINYGKCAGLSYRNIVEKKPEYRRLVAGNYIFGWMLYHYWKCKY